MAGAPRPASPHPPAIDTKRAVPARKPPRGRDVADRVALLRRGVALANVYGGVSAIPLALTMPGLTVVQRVVSAVIGGLIGAAGVAVARRPGRWSARIGQTQRWWALWALVLLTASTAAFGVARNPLTAEACVVVGMGASALGPRAWPLYGAVAALLTLATGSLTGHSDGLMADRFLGWVLVGASASLVVAAYFGAYASTVSLRLRRLQTIVRRDGDRIARVNGLVDDLRALQQRSLLLLGKFEAFAASLPSGQARDVAQAVVASRGALVQSIDVSDDDAAHGGGLSALLTSTLESFTQLTLLRGVRLTLDVDEDVAAVPVRVGEAVKEFLLRSLDNVDRWAPTATLVTVSAQIVDTDWLRVSVEDDGAGPLPDSTGEGSAHNIRQLAALGGDFRYEAADRGLRAVARIPLIGMGAPAGPGRDRPADRLVPAVARTASQLFRATRWAMVVSMLAMTALDVPGGTLIGRLAPAVIAVIVVEAAFWRAGLRGDRPDALPWVLVAVAAAIIASGVVSQADRFQINGWVGIILLELAWRYGWRWWLAAEAIRLPVVIAGLGPLGSANLGGAIAAQVAFPLIIGITALGAHSLVNGALELELELGSTSERWRRISEAVRCAVLRHDIVAPLTRAMNDRGEHPLARELAELNAELRDTVDELASLCTLEDELRSTVIDTLAAVVAPAPVRLVHDDLLLLQRPGFPGDTIDRYGRRSSLLDLLAKLAEVCVERCPPDITGRPRLRALEVALLQTYPDEPITLTVAPIARHAPGRSDDDELSHYAATVGATITEGLTDGTVTLRLPVAAFA